MPGSPIKTERKAAFDRWAADPEGALKELCEWVETRGTDGHLMAFTRAKGFAYTSIRDWIAGDSARSLAYATARERRADVIAEELIAIADEPPGLTPAGAVDPAAVAHQRLRVETRRWAASKLAPRRYGDKVELEAKISSDPVGDLVRRIHAADTRVPLSPTSCSLDAHRDVHARVGANRGEPG